MRRTRLAVSLCLALAASGCSGVVEILQPPLNGPVAPMPTFSVKIGSNYTGSFSADLDGAPITSWFTPAAANTTVTAQVPACFQTASATHELIARANSSSTGIVINNDIHGFTVPSLQFQPTSITGLHPGQSRTVLMNLTVGWPQNLPVTLQPTNTTVSVNGAPAGAASTATIPANNVASFTVTGISPGSFVIQANGRGIQCGGISGAITN
jgi:hypothetical protein